MTSAPPPIVVDPENTAQATQSPYAMEQHNATAPRPGDDTFLLEHATTFGGFLVGSLNTITLLLRPRRFWNIASPGVPRPGKIALLIAILFLLLNLQTICLQQLRLAIADDWFVGLSSDARMLAKSLLWPTRSATQVRFISNEALFLYVPLLPWLFLWPILIRLLAPRATSSIKPQELARATCYSLAPLLFIPTFQLICIVLTFAEFPARSLGNTASVESLTDIWRFLDMIRNKLPYLCAIWTAWWWHAALSVAFKTPAAKRIIIATAIITVLGWLFLLEPLRGTH
ncbi:MAG: hypothetical protein NTV94_00725 [Planctomycetota bacterium]|nr:hypothetical protein [Planctomycetota bacterium]